MTKLEIINETVKYYSENPRSVSFLGGCKYYFKGRMCAIGRCVIDPEGFQEEYLSAGVSKISHLDFKLKPEYRGHETEFWSALQTFHDSHVNWNDAVKALTPIGKIQLEWMMEVYNE